MEPHIPFSGGRRRSFCSTMLLLITEYNYIFFFSSPYSIDQWGCLHSSLWGLPFFSCPFFQGQKGSQRSFNLERSPEECHPGPSSLLFRLPLSLRTRSCHNELAVSLLITPNWHTASFCLEPPRDVAPSGRQGVGVIWGGSKGREDRAVSGLETEMQYSEEGIYRMAGGGGSDTEWFTHDQANRKTERACIKQCRQGDIHGND